MSEQPDEKIAHLEAAIEVHQDAISRYKGEIATLKALRYHGVSPSEAPEFPEVGNYPWGYSKSATGAMEARTVHIPTPPTTRSRAFWPDAAPVAPTWMTDRQAEQPVEDIRIDPPYDR